MTVRRFDAGKIRTFYPEGQKEPDGFFIKCRPFNTDTRRIMSRLITEKMEAGDATYPSLNATIRAYADDWGNMTDENGEQLAMPRGADGLMTDEGVDWLSPDIQQQYRQFIDSQSSLTEDQERG